MFVSATRSLISAHDARPRGDLQTSDSGMYVGAVTPPSVRRAVKITVSLGGDCVEESGNIKKKKKHGRHKQAG